MNDIIEKKKKVILELMNDKTYIPMKFKELAVVLNITKENRDQLEEVLSELLEERKISITKKGKYVITKEHYIEGYFISNDRGFGFVEVEGQDEDYFIPEDKVNGAFHHDMVLIQVEDSQTGKRKEARVVKVLSHEIQQVVGYFQKSKTFGYVLPDNQKIAQDIYIPGKDTMGAVTGHKVVVQITDYGTNGRKPEGKIIEIIGHINDPGVDIISIVKNYDIPTEFPEEVMKQIENIPDEVPEEDKVGRKDIRDWQTVTIDGEDAKDLDDAVTLTKEDGIYTLGVHIADVSHYVTENSPLDKEAVKRGTSVYLVDRVIPMIPHKLSNGICSLNHDVDRLALSCIMKINEKGEIIDHEIVESLINVNERMTYTAVKEIIVDKNPETMERYKDLVPMFELMAELSEILRERRYKRGAIDFEFPECKIKLNQGGKPISIEPYDRNKATKIIEDFMLAANETIAEDFYWRQLPFVYRNHEEPDMEKVSQLTTFINNFGYSVKMSKEQIHPKELQKLLKNIEGTPEEALISRITLRSMKRAEYTPECKGHFGLAAKYYCHFTSPIRRYPDLLVHRLIKEFMLGKKETFATNPVSYFMEKVNKSAIQASLTERKAEVLERDCVDLKKTEYMSNFIGETFKGILSSITQYGLYIMLDNTVEGLVKYNQMTDDYYEIDELKGRVKGEKTRKVYQIGDKVIVRVIKTNLEKRAVEFRLLRKDK